MRQRAAVAMLAVAVAALHAVLGLAMRAPVIHPDELGYVSAARFLAGRGLAPQTEYFPGYSLLLVPVARVISDPLRLWHAALLVNAVLAGLTVVLAAALVRRLAPGLPTGHRLLVVGALSLYAPLLLWSNLAIAENVLIPGFLAGVLLVWRAFESGRPGWWAGAGAATAALYGVHPRGIVIALALVAVALVTQRPWRTHTRPLTALAAGMGAVGAAAWLLATWVAREAPASARAYDVSGTLTKNFTGTKLAGLAAEIGGQIWYLTVATWGLFPIGMAACLALLGRVVTGRRRDPEAATAAFVALSVLGVMALGSLFINNDVRLDYLVYGRYNEGVLAPVLLLGLLAVTRLAARATSSASTRARSLRVAALVVAGTMGASAAVLVLGRGAATFDLPVVRSNVLGLDALLAWRGYTLPVVVISLAGLLGAGLVLAAGWVRPLAAVAVTGALFVPSVMSGQQFLVDGSHQRATERAVATAVGAVDRRVAGAPSCVAYDLAGVSRWHEANYRMFLPGVRLQAFTSMSGRAPCSELVVSGRSDFATAFPGSRRVMLENNYHQSLWALPGPVQDRLAMAGWLLPVALPSPLPTTARHYRMVPAPHRPLPRVLAFRAGRHADLDLVVTHTGTGTPWPNTFGLRSAIQAVRIGVRWYRLGEPGRPDGFPTIDWARTELPRSLLPGESVPVRVRLEPRERDGAPLSAGTYQVQVEVVQDGVGWFVADGGPLTVEVVVVDHAFLAR